YSPLLLTMRRDRCLPRFPYTTLFRSPLGYVTVYAEIAGGSMDKGEDFSSILFPIMKQDEVEQFLETFLPDYAGIQHELTPLPKRSEEHTSELQSRFDLVCRLLLEKKK